MSLVSKSLALLGSLLMLVPATPAFSDHQDSIAGEAVVPHEAIVRFEPGVNAESVLAGYGFEVLNVLGKPGQHFPHPTGPNAVHHRAACQAE